MLCMCTLIHFDVLGGAFTAMFLALIACYRNPPAGVECLDATGGTMAF